MFPDMDFSSEVVGFEVFFLRARDARSAGVSEGLIGQEIGAFFILVNCAFLMGQRAPSQTDFTILPYGMRFFCQFS